MNNFNNQIFLKIISTSKLNEVRDFIKDYSNKYNISELKDEIHPILEKIIESNEPQRFEILIKFSNFKIKNYIDYIFPYSVNYPKVLKWLYFNKYYNNQIIENAFYEACLSNNIEQVKWLKSLGTFINYHKNNDELFRLSCNKQCYDSVILLCKFTNFRLKIESYFNDQYIDEVPFHFFCRHNYLELAKLYVKEFDFDISTLNHEAISLSCQEGHLEMAKFCYQLGGDLTINNNWCLTISITKNNLDIILWIFSLNIINFHYNDEYIFKLACTYNSFELAKFVYSLKDFDKTKFDFDFFFNTILICNLDFIKWLYKEFNFNINESDNIIFKYVCQDGDLEKIKWIYSLGNLDIHMDKDYAFRVACSSGFNSIAYWIYSLGNVKIKSCNNQAFVSACQSNNVELAKWLSELNPQEYKITIADNIITFFQVIKLIMIHGSKQIEEESDCCICYESSDLVTHCKHNFCKKCFLNYINSRNSEYEEVPCPYCREKNMKIYELVKEVP